MIFPIINFTWQYLAHLHRVQEAILGNDAAGAAEIVTTLLERPEGCAVAVAGQAVTVAGSPFDVNRWFRVMNLCPSPKTQRFEGCLQYSAKTSAKYFKRDRPWARES